eukprot:158184_1
MKTIEAKDQSCISNAQRKKFSTTTDADDVAIRYSYGYRFFYWSFYQNNKEECDPAQVDVGNVLVANDGCKLCDFYVPAKYNSLKDEIMKNNICSLNVYQWNILVQKSTYYLQTSYVKTMECGIIYAKELYNMAELSPLHFDHLISIMVYCNYDKLQQKFSETYRKTDKNESNASLIRRHSNYAHLGRLLRELVECYGSIQHTVSTNNIFYHGMTIQTQFQSIDACIKGPVSTTTSFTVAAAFCNNQGIILQMTLSSFWGICRRSFTWSLNNAAFRAYSVLQLFECPFISDYPNEQEVFFVGGYSTFLFQSIIRVPTAQNYDRYVLALSLISEVLTNGGVRHCVNTNKWDTIQKTMCFIIISHQFSIHYPKGAYHFIKSIPSYARGLCNHHFRNIIQVRLFITAYDECRFVEDIFRSLILYDNGWIKLDVLTTIFPSLQCINFYDQHENDTFIK